MLTFRRASRSYVSWITRTPSLCAKSAIPSGISKQVDGLHRSEKCITKGFYPPAILYYEHRVSAKLIWGCRSLSVQAGESTDVNDHDGGLSNLESCKGSDTTGTDIDNENSGWIAEAFSMSSSEESKSEIDLPGEKGLENKSSTSPLFKVLVEVPSNSVTSALEKWIEEGNLLERSEVSVTILSLRKRQFYRKALQFVEWLEATERLDCVEHDYATHLDLVAKVHGPSKAEKYIDTIPESFRGEVVYRTLLANYVSSLNLKKAEEVFNKIRELGLPISIFSYNQLVFLYKRVNRKKIADVLLMMEKESINPSYFTYMLLIDLKGRSRDIAGMEQIVEKMKDQGLEPDIVIRGMIAGFYIFGGLTEKAELTLKEMEGYDIKKNREVCKYLLPLYASLGKVDDLERVWKVCMENLRFGEALVAIEAWGKVGHVEKAEEVFEKLANSSEKLSSKYYDALLNVYTEHNLISKGKILAERMKDKGCNVGPSTWEALTKLYVKAGEVEKADSALQKAHVTRKNKFPYKSFVILLGEYSKRGDVHNAERMFLGLRKAGYINKTQLYEILLEAYSNAKLPAYGFRQRMKADKVNPNKRLTKLLENVTRTMPVKADKVSPSKSKPLPVRAAVTTNAATNTSSSIFTAATSRATTKTLCQIFGAGGAKIT